MPSQEMGKKTVPKRLICDISETEMDGKAAEGERHTQWTQTEAPAVAFSIRVTSSNR